MKEQGLPLESTDGVYAGNRSNWRWQNVSTRHANRWACATNRTVRFTYRKCTYTHPNRTCLVDRGPDFIELETAFKDMGYRNLVGTNASGGTVQPGPLYFWEQLEFKLRKNMVELFKRYGSELKDAQLEMLCPKAAMPRCLFFYNDTECTDNSRHFVSSDTRVWPQLAAWEIKAREKRGLR
jgi:hypothetical protein